MIQKELIDSEWIYMDSTLALLFKVVVYNPNYRMMHEKTFLIEFLDTGGLINFEHDSVLVNTHLYRSEGHQLMGVSLFISGIGLCVISIIDIKQELEEQRQMSKKDEEEGDELDQD